MTALTSIAEEIATLKQERRAVILAHHYQDAEIQDLADAVGDSLELARKAQEFSGDVIAFCGVWFMAETAKVLNPQRIVVVPDRRSELQPGGKLPGGSGAGLSQTASRSCDRQLHQYVGGSEGGERYSLHIAQRRRRSSIPFQPTSRFCFCPISTSGITSNSKPAART